ncbi:cytochrome C [Geomonas propionica]|uniref:Cytochrome C n=1 Tax=Geomonas propionica TaxID=2798582 RepID=A0ABS0YRE4_9BACT|nr:cytochrome C [Geomonas propionica]MBJ6800508.1 cytochrome C [Geomonas propionica]
MFLKKHTVAVMFLLGISCAPLLAPGTANAIPAFSRQHKTECSTCHTIYPELNEFGDAFLKNGYVYPHKKEGAKAAAKDTEPGNEWSFISGLPQQIPLSLTATADIAYDEDAADGNKVDLSTRSITLQAGGSFRDMFGFFATYNLYSQGMQRASSLTNPANNTNVPPSNDPDLDELFLVWRQAVGSPVNVKVGRFEPKLSLWKKSNRILPVPSYASTTYRVGASPFSSDATEDGVELNALLGNRVFVAGGVVDRNGQDREDGYGHISLKIGGTDFKGQEPEVDLEKDSLWDYLSVTLGGFGYWGQNGEFNASGVAQNLNNFRRIGAEADILYQRLHLKGSGSFGRDSNPEFGVMKAPVDSKAYALEAEYYMGAPVNLVPLFRYEYLNAGDGVIKRLTPAITYAPLQNVRMSIEYTHSIAPEGTGNIAFASIAFSM